jgi:hypothetical protein
MLPSQTPCPTPFCRYNCACFNVLAISLCIQPYGDDEHDDDNENGPITVLLLLPFKDWSTKLQAWSMMAKV